MMRQAFLLVGFSQSEPLLPRAARLLEYPTSGYALKYMTSAVWMVCIEATAAASLARILPCSRLGMAMAAMIKTTITTSRTSTSENPAGLGLASLIERFVLTIGIEQP